MDPSEARGYLDSYERLGRMLLAGASWSGREKHSVFLNTHDERFARIDAVSGLYLPDDGRAIAQVDWDHDGDLDLWLVNRTGPTARFMRNDTPREGHFIRLRLRGDTDNRDGIGARVSVYFAGREVPLMRTVTAGRAYLSQASKWVHVGLGDMGAIERVVVRWPSGDEQSFGGLRVDTWYELTQGQPQAKAWTPPARQVALRAKKVYAPAPSAIARVPLTIPQPMPGELAFESAQGGQVTLESLQGSPVLINLWATWCAPCIEELKQLAEHSDELNAAGLRIVALNVDGLGDARGADRDKVDVTLEQLGWTFDSGYASEQTLMRLAAVRAQTFDYDRPLVVPTSFLIDADGRLSAIYTGPVAADRLVRDVQLVNIPIEILRDHTLPLAGTWFSPPREVLTPELLPKRAREKFSLGARLAQEGQIAAAIDNYMTGLAMMPDVEAFIRVAFLFVQINEAAAAEEMFNEALKLDDRQARAWYGLGMVEAGRGDYPAAIAHFRKAIELAHDEPEPRFQLARAQAAAGEVEEAIAGLRAVVASTPRMLQARLVLGTLLIEHGDTAEAISVYRDARRVAPDDVTVSNSLAWALATWRQASDKERAEALDIAQRNVEATQGRNPLLLDTLAAAQAATGRFEDAAATQARAIAILEAAEATEQLPAFRERAARYQRGEAYVEGGGD